MNTSRQGKEARAHNDSQEAGSQFDFTPPDLLDPRLHEMDHDLQAALTSPPPVGSPKSPPHSLYVPRLLDAKPAPATSTDGTRFHEKPHEAIQRWLAETQKEKLWDGVGSVATELDSKEATKGSHRGAKDWSDVAQDGSELSRVHR